MRDLFVDSFAGGGGASLGIEWALGRSPDIAINHDPAALAMHAANHPETLHLPHNVWKVSLRDIVGDRTIGGLWMSPDCRHHSKAKGGAPVSASVRDLAWVLMRWLKELRPEQLPRRIYLENVEEFRDWGPLVVAEDGTAKPCPDRKGETFRAWVRELKRRYGYKHVEWREIRGCWFGAPTIRKRLCLIASRDAVIVWPEPTHADPKADAVRSGDKPGWPVAADIIDWARPCPSIFLTRDEAKAHFAATGVRIIRPLAEKTEARIAKGVKRYVLDAAQPFVVTCNHGGEGFRGQGIDKPFATVTRARDAHGIVVPHVMTMRNSQKPHTAADEAVHTVTSGGAGLSLVESAIAPFVTYGEQGGASRPADSPLHTVTASRKDTDGVAAATLVSMRGKSADRDPSEPLASVTGKATHALAGVFLAQHNENRVGRAADEPLATITTRATQTHQVAAYLAQHNTDMVGHDAREPVSTIVGKGCTQGLVAAMLSHAYTSNTAGGQGDPDKSLKTIMAGGNHAALVSLPLMTAYYSTGGQHAAIDDPMLTVPGHARFGLVEAGAAPPPLTEAQLGRARQVAEFLRRHGCWEGGDLVTVAIGGETYVVVDIGMRMLTARELARAQGFPDDYILAAPFGGGVLSDTEIRHKIGNSVCPDVARALVAANSPEMVEMREAAE